MTNPLNQLPINADLVQQLDAETKRLCQKFGGLVFLVHMRENEKAFIGLEHDEKSAALAQMSEDVPRFLINTAMILRAYDHFEKQEESH